MKEQSEQTNLMYPQIIMEITVPINTDPTEIPIIIAPTENASFEFTPFATFETKVDIVSGA